MQSFQTTLKKSSKRGLNTWVILGLWGWKYERKGFSEKQSEN